VTFAASYADRVMRLSEADAATLVARAFDLDVVSATRLDTERDDSFHVVTADGEYGFKLAHPDDSAALIDLQSAALAHAASSGLPLQRVLGNLTHEGRIGRLLTWLPGTPLFEVSMTSEKVEALGAILGRLSRSLADFEHPAARRPFAWDVLQLESSRPLIPLCPEVEPAFAFARERIGTLPMQVAHNDFHPGNVVADKTGQVTGILDFGDVVYTARAADLAIALTYLVTTLGRDDTDRFIAGFASVVELEQAEWDALPALMAARYTQRVLNNLELARGNPDDRGAAHKGAERNVAALRDLLHKEN
jgi:hydroxylysine kinase